MQVNYFQKVPFLQLHQKNWMKILLDSFAVLKNLSKYVIKFWTQVTFWKLLTCICPHRQNMFKMHLIPEKIGLSKSLNIFVFCKCWETLFIYCLFHTSVLNKSLIKRLSNFEIKASLKNLLSNRKTLLCEIYYCQITTKPHCCPKMFF